MNSEHVEVLRHMKETIRAIMPSEVAALDAAIASLSAQLPAEAQPVGVEGFRDWVIEQMPAGTVIDNPELWAERLARAYELNVPPPSAPVGVDDAEVWLFKGSNGAWHTFHSEKHRLDTIADGGWDVRKFTTLAQQPAAVDEAMVELARKARELQKRYYGNGIGLHLSMISWAQEYDALASQQGGRHD